MKWKTDLFLSGLKPIFPYLLILLFAAHLPFLNADPDIDISFSRGPFTDEGLNTLQVRNWVNHGYLDLAECDNLLKTPLLGFPLAMTYKIFGTSLTVSRLHVLILVLTAMAFIGQDRKHRNFMIIFILVILTQYSIFQFSHYSLAEMLASSAVLLSIHFLARSSDLQFGLKSRNRMAVFSGIFLSLAYFIKIQFIYLILLLPLIQLLRLIFNAEQRQPVIRQGFILSATLLGFLIFYVIAWYLPNRESYDLIMTGQSGEFSLTGKTSEYIIFNLWHFFFQGWIQWLVYVFIISVVVGLMLLKKQTSSRYRVLFLSSLTWFLLESHKLAMVYLPTRYRISFYISMGLLISIVLSEILNLKDSKIAGIISSPVFKTLSIAAIAFMLLLNIMSYQKTWQRRSFTIRETNDYLAEKLHPGDVVIGAWAPSLTWKSKSRALPVWNNFLNYEDPIHHFQPVMVIAEPDEQDSEQAYLSQGIQLYELADSAKTVRIGNWDVMLYWMK